MLPRPKRNPGVATESSSPAPVLQPSSSGSASTRFRFRQRVGTKHVLQFTEQLSTLLEAGLPLDRALHVSLGTIEHEEFRKVVQGLFVEVEKGHTLADAFAKYPGIFPRLYINMIRAGEEGGVLPVVLSRLIDFYTRSLEFRAFLITSSIYPALLFVFGTGALLVLTVFVLPKLGQIFTDMNQALPLPAAILISTGEYLKKYGWILIVALVFGGAAFFQATRSDAGRERWQRFVLSLPIIGSLVVKVQLARVCRTWGTLLSGGVPILTGMRIVRELSDNRPLRRSLDRLQRAVKEGQGISKPLLADPFFPRLLGQLAAIGEESGALDKMLTKVADQYENDIRKATRNLVALFEPAMILVMGGMIGIIVVSMLTAIFSINDMPL